MRKLIPLGLFLALVTLTYLYLIPGSEALFNQRTDSVMGDDTDGATLPYAYDNMLKTWHEHPSRMFYGTVYVDGADPERGVAQWVAWNERWIVTFCAPFFKLEQLSTAVVFVLMLLNALAMFALSRYLKWNRSVSFGLGMAWAFCAFTRARAKVHMSMAGTYHLPLIFLGLFLVTRGRGKRSLIAAGAAFTLAMTVIHYFQVTTIFLSPLLLLFVAMQPETRADWRRVARRLALAAIPAVLFVGWNFAVPVPANSRMSRESSFPKGGETLNTDTHPFLLYFAARPLDYLGGDISFKYRPDDSNPLRAMVNEHILTHLEGGNAHERSNGIRWSIIILGLLAVAQLARGKFRKDVATRNNILFFSIFAALTFWLSLSPNFPFYHMGLSYWLHELVSQVRVPSRAGINVHFSLLMIVGFYLASATDWRRWLRAAGVFPLLMLIDYPPLQQDMPMAPMRPAFSELQRSHGPCGAGFYFPFVNFYAANQIYYLFVQRMRESDCQVLNAMSTPARLEYMTRTFPPQVEYIRQLPNDEATARNLERLARCMPLTWLIFDPGLPQPWREEMCRRLGWTLYPDLSCISPNKATLLQKYPDQCD